VNIKLKRGIFHCDVSVSGTFIAIGINSKVSSVNNNNCFDTNFYSCIEPRVNPEWRAALPQRQRHTIRITVLILGSELEQYA
jgi:hypothetical protein